jgi:hypothetical protein
MNTAYCNTEKAGVGGSTPSLATIFSITYVIFVLIEIGF